MLQDCLTSITFCTFLGLLFGFRGGLEPVIARKSASISSHVSVIKNFFGFSCFFVVSKMLQIGFDIPDCPLIALKCFLTAVLGLRFHVLCPNSFWSCPSPPIPCSDVTVNFFHHGGWLSSILWVSHPKPRPKCKTFLFQHYQFPNYSDSLTQSHCN